MMIVGSVGRRRAPPHIAARRGVIAPAIAVVPRTVALEPCAILTGLIATAGHRARRGFISRAAGRPVFGAIPPLVIGIPIPLAFPAIAPPGPCIGPVRRGSTCRSARHGMLLRFPRAGLFVLRRWNGAADDLGLRSWFGCGTGLGGRAGFRPGIRLGGLGAGRGAGGSFAIGCSLAGPSQHQCRRQKNTRSQYYQLRQESLHSHGCLIHDDRTGQSLFRCW